MCVCDEDSVAKLFVRVCVLKCVLRFQVFINIIYLCVQNIYIPITILSIVNVTHLIKL